MMRSSSSIVFPIKKIIKATTAMNGVKMKKYFFMERTGNNLLFFQQVFHTKIDCSSNRSEAEYYCKYGDFKFQPMI